MTQNETSKRIVLSKIVSKNKEIRLLKKDRAILRKENAGLREQNYELIKIGKTLQAMLDRTFKEITMINVLAEAIRDRKSSQPLN